MKQTSDTQEPAGLEAVPEPQKKNRNWAKRAFAGRLGEWKRRLPHVCLGLIVLAGVIGCWSATHHLVRTENGLAIIRKRYFKTEQSWVDIRGWEYQDFQANAEVTKALTAQGYGDLVKHPPVVRTPGPFERIGNTLRRWGSSTSEGVRQVGQQAGVIAQNAASELRSVGEFTYDWALDVVDYWKNKAEG